MRRTAPTERMRGLSPPPPPKDVLQFLGWLISFWKEGRTARGSSERSMRAERSNRESVLTVVIAISTDLTMLVAKAFAAVLTGSVALFAETLHSLADTGNQLLLFKGLRGARKQADLRHPLGYGSEVFFWSLLAALGIFAVGGVLAIWEGVQHLLHPIELRSSLLGCAVLAMGCVFDGISWLTSFRQLRREATQRGVPFKKHLRSTTDTAVTAVFYEDSGAIIGNLLALTGLGIHEVTGSPVPDAVAGIIIGIQLTVIGMQLAARNRDLLTNRSDSPVVLDRIRDLLAATPEVAGVGKLLSIFVGPHKLLVIAEVQPKEGLSGDDLCEVLGRLRGSVAESVQRSALVFLMPVVAVEERAEPTPWSQEYWLRLFPDDEQV